jgi:simple sugar transport system ATP-binding protein
MDNSQPASAAEARFAVQMRDITKRFPGVLANSDVDLVLRQGEVLALLGENGAGKSTLMNVLAGLYQAEEGEVYVHGQPVHFRSPGDAIAHGIGMVHQHFMLVETLTVAENIILGLHGGGAVLKLDEVADKLEDLSRRYGLKVDPHAYIWQLSVGEQQRVEILKLLYRGADVLILDEPTAVLTPQEAADMATTLRQMVDEGKSIIFITHKLDEVMAFADRVMVLRGGKVEAALGIEGTTKEHLAELMVGREVLFLLDKAACKPGEAALEVDGLEALNDKGLPALRGVSLRICAGEIVGIAGVAGNGQRELAEVIAGLRPSTAGRVRVGGEDITGCTPLEVIQAGVSHIPGDRLGVGLVPNLSISDNVGLKAYREPPLARGPLLDGRALGRFAEKLIETFGIATPGPETAARLLSGGNQQKVIVAREFSRPIKLLIAAQPTRGVDVGSIEYIHQHVLDKRDEGIAVLLISVELDEIMALSDRIAVMYEGEIVGVVDADTATREGLGLLMAGERESASDRDTGGQVAEEEMP